MGKCMSLQEKIKGLLSKRSKTLSNRVLKMKKKNQRSASHIYNSYLTISKQFNSTSLTGFYSESQNQPLPHALPPPTLCSLQSRTKPVWKFQTIVMTFPEKPPGCLFIPRLGPIPSTKSVIWVTLKLWYIHGLEKQAQRFLAGMKSRN